MKLAGFDTQHVALTGSTNSDLLEAVRAAAAAGAAAFAPRLLVAERQAAGRGRHGRHWQDSAGGSLLASWAWPFPASLDLSGLSLAVGAVLAGALDPAGGRLGLKWPNDLLCLPGSDAAPLGRKLAGVLIETAALGAQRVAVIGIGVNVRGVTVEGAASGVAMLCELDAHATPASALASLATPLAEALRQFEDGGLAPFAAAYAARDLLRGRCVQAGPEGEIRGTAAGVTGQGELRVETARGIVSVRSGEVRLRVIAGAEAAPC